MAIKNPICFLLYVLIPSFAAFCLANNNDCPSISSKATYYKTPDGQGTPNGACGLKEWGKSINDGKVAAVSSKLFKCGKGCGTCFEVKCKDKKWCSEKGTKLVVTDYGEGPETDFIMSPKAFAEMAKDKESENYLFKKSVVEVKYERVKCHYYNEGSDFVVKYDKKNSSWPDYISLIILYKGDEEYVEDVKIFVKDEKDKKVELVPMRRAYGAVWDIANHNIIPMVEIKTGKGVCFEWIEGVEPKTVECDIRSGHLKQPVNISERSSASHSM
ncbi:OLC1v1031614C1 [Oldenlandia corymbosa var. corymbosa]|uniref:OLC1v1031614C1 n=1 Tax=Oldenlandia corymbosa var. corymbosa TaxID=529605 RepID=A0AAV1CKU1_OLDCO|nr:OLC1v1031614C1 [Oldenlandia corymbosa var. corymbosa]